MDSRADHLLKRLAIEQGADALENVRRAFERAAEELAHYQQRYRDAETLNDRASVLNWAIGYAAGATGSNMRLDMVAGAQAALGKAAARAAD